MATEYLWQAVEEPGFEHVRVDASHPGWDVYDSMLVRAHDGEVRRGGFTLILDKAFRTLEIRIMAEQEPGSMAALHLLASGDGTWADAEERRIPELDGCIDLDIEWTPLTNTLPVRRLNLAIGEEQTIEVAYISLPSLDVQRAEQHYTRLDEHTVRFSTASRDFTRDIVLDADGFVIEYPGLFRRAFPATSSL